MTNEERRNRRKNDPEYRGRCHELERASRKRLRQDPAYAEKNKVWQKRYRDKHPEKQAQKSLEWCEKLKARYRTEPEFRRGRIEYSKRYGKANRVSVNARKRGYKVPGDKQHARVIKCKYGLTKEGYQTLLELQGHVCAICCKPETVIEKRWNNTAPKKLSVDHCHVTGSVRGLLCAACNRGLGSFKDNAEVLKNAAAYLLR